MTNEKKQQFFARLPLVRTIALTALLAAGTAMAATTLSVPSGHNGLFAHLHGGDHTAMHTHFQQVLRDVGASDAQQKRIESIVAASMDQQHTDMRRYHDTAARLKTLLTAPGIDLNAVDTVRAEQDQLAVATSRRITDTALAVAKELTPAQRAKLGERIDQMLAAHLGHDAR